MICPVAETNDVSTLRETVSPQNCQRLILCPSGCNATSVSYDMSIDSDHFTCVCSDCICKWYICLNYPRQHTQFLKYRQLKRHQISCKSSTNKLTYRHSNSSNKSISFFDFMKFPHFGGKENAEYYFHDKKNEGHPTLLVYLNIIFPTSALF